MIALGLRLAINVGISSDEGDCPQRWNQRAATIEIRTEWNRWLDLQDGRQISDGEPLDGWSRVIDRREDPMKMKLELMDL